MLISWSQYLSVSPETSSQKLSKSYDNKYIKIEDAVMHFEKFYKKNISF